MSLTSLTRHIDRDSRRRERIAAGSLIARYLPERDARIVRWGGAIGYNLTIKPAGLSIPEGAIVIAVRRDQHGLGHPLLIEAFEGDYAAFASFPRLAHMLGATELHVGLTDRTVLDRIIAVRDLTDRSGGRVAYDCLDRAALLSRPLTIAGAYDRSAIMTTACTVAKARQALTGETWAACLSVALKGTWTLARAARAAALH